MNKQQLQQEIADLQKQLEEKQKALSAMPDKWEPMAGKFYVDEVGLVSEYSSNLAGICDFGNEYATREQAEKAAKAMRAHNRLLAYVAEFAPDWEADWNDTTQKRSAVVLNGENYEYWDYVTSYPLGAVIMPRHIARELAEKLNSGEVEL